MSKTKITRRDFAKKSAQVSLGAAVVAAGCKTNSEKMSDSNIEATVNSKLYDFIVVGSGAGGGPVAANLARAGYEVFLLEAGSMYENPNYSVPAFHGRSTVDANMAWDFRVKHFSNMEHRKRDPKVDATSEIFYPRSATVGGCTAHHAMFFVYPNNEDWNYIARTMNDNSFSAENMREYFKRLENCKHAKITNLFNQEKHGFDGWLPVTQTSKSMLIDDFQLADIALGSAKYFNLLEAGFADDPNAWSTVSSGREGFFNMTLNVYQGRRYGSRERIKDIMAKHPNKLVLESDALVTKVIIEDQLPQGGDPKKKRRAVGVVYRKGKSIYQADPRFKSSNPSEERIVKLKKGGEVILAGGAFNTPQILNLSGIGDHADLSRFSDKIKLEPKELKGVGKNLQDRYETTYIVEMEKDFDILRNCTFGAKTTSGGKDTCLTEWEESQKQFGDYSGLYSSNGFAFGLKVKSNANLQDPDMFIFGGPAHFEGYEPKYMDKTFQSRRHFTWAVLKGQTENNIGTVKLKSADWAERPEINFKKFNDQPDRASVHSKDAEAVYKGMKVVENIMSSAPIADNVSRVIHPKPEIMADKQKLIDHIRYESWGHHASCTCKMGVESDVNAVVDQRFRVYHTDNLRIVDASIFPKIPGLFIAAPIYMMAEKASDIIIMDYKSRRV